MEKASSVSAHQRIVIAPESAAWRGNDGSLIGRSTMDGNGSSSTVSTSLFPNPYPLAPNPVVNRRDRRSPTRPLDHLTIECVSPELDGGRYAVKRVVGDAVWVGADIFKEGHDLLAARAIYKGPGDTGWSSAPMSFAFDSDRWYGSFLVDRMGLWKFTVEGWTDAFGT